MALEFEYRDGEEEKLTTWAWFTINSYNQSILSQDIKPSKKICTLNDLMILKTTLSSLGTGQNLARRWNINRRAAASALNQKRVITIKDLFTAPCPQCGHIGGRIPREMEKWESVPPGLYCPVCEVSFPSISIHSFKPGFIVAAGPSLDKNVNELKRIMGKYPIFSVDTALPTLQANKIKPDYVVSVEQDPLINRMRGLNTEETILIATLNVDPEFRNSWKGQVALMDSPPGGRRDKEANLRMFGDVGWACPGGNVSTMAFSLMTGLLFSHIVFVGHDFSYPGLEKYYPKDGPKSMIPIKQVMKTHDIYGKVVYADLSLFGYKNWTEGMVSFIAKSNGNITRFINATEGGIFGAQYYDPKRFIKYHNYRRELQYKLRMWMKEKRWASKEEAQENGFKGKNLDCIEYMTLKEAIDKYCPLAVKE